MKNRMQRRQWSWGAFFALTSVDVVSAAIYLGVLVAHIPGGDVPHTWWQSALSIVLILALFVVDRVESLWFSQAPPTHVAVSLLVARIALMAVVVQLDASTLAWFLFLIPPFRASLYFGSRISYVVAGITWIGFFLVHWANQSNMMSHESQDLILFAMALVFVCTIARALREERESREHSEELLAELARTHAQLQASGARVAEFATTAERNRLARDIHDSLGHYLTVANVQIAKAIAYQYRDPTVAERAMRDAKDTAHDALRAVRQSVGALRTAPDAFDFADAMTALVERTRTDGCAMAMRMEGNEGFFGAEMLTTLYYVAQEGLTNIQKHAHATEVSIDLRFAEYEARLTIQDNGVGCDRDPRDATDHGADGGYGFQSMRGRLARVGGRLIITSAPGAGTTLTAVAPRTAMVAAELPGMAQGAKVKT